MSPEKLTALILSASGVIIVSLGGLVCWFSKKLLGQLEDQIKALAEQVQGFGCLAHDVHYIKTQITEMNSEIAETRDVRAQVRILKSEVAKLKRRRSGNLIAEN
jgi:cell division protein FtsB